VERWITVQLLALGYHTRNYGTSDPKSAAETYDKLDEYLASIA
jgi:hypothetical protein